MLEPLIDSFRTASILVILMYMFIFYVYKERKVRIDVIFMRHFKPCGFRVNVSIMFKKSSLYRSSVCRSGAEIFMAKASENAITK